MQIILSTYFIGLTRYKPAARSTGISVRFSKATVFSANCNKDSSDPDLDHDNYPSMIACIGLNCIEKQ